MATQIRRPAALARFEQRGTERASVTVTRASVREHGDQPSAAVLVDLSIYGCRVAVSGLHDEGARLWLRFDGGWPISAQVVWARDGQIGCRFDQPLANALVRQLARG